MKAKLLFFITLGIIPYLFSLSQNVPNGGFEDWEMRTLYEEPDNWYTGNREAFIFGMSTAFSTDDSYSGTLALRLESTVTEEDTLFGYAFSNGSITGGELYDTLQFEGGFPVSAAPDSLFAYMKFELAENDTAIVLVSFKKEGAIISQNVFYLTEDAPAYTRMGWEITMLPDTPDTALIGFAASNPYNTMIGGYLQVDSVWFGNLPGTVPNADFENWHEESYQEPAGWVTTNLFSQLFGGDISASPTVDANSGDFALRLEAIHTAIPSDSGGFDEVTGGFAMAYEQSFMIGEDLPSFPIGFNPTLLTGFYKFDPLLNDTAMIFVGLTDNLGIPYQAGLILPATDEYTAFEIPLNYPDFVSITEVNLIASTSLYFMESGENSPELGSVLWLDDLHLVNPCETFAPYEIASVTQPTCDDNTATLDAGDGWDEYHWSNDETTQVITVVVTEASTYSVTVVDSETDCEFSDEAEVTPATGCENALPSVMSTESSIDVYPNPSYGALTVEFRHAPGTYTIELMDITGRIWIQRIIDDQLQNSKQKLDVSLCPEGIYLLKVHGSKMNHCQKIVIR